ncbi:class I SAM-dependent methyltransferase [Mangrovihabitans endophyticus]|uniref:Methyltransferase domain-containing protein n=1 Tax=Mangrovihabitans endophyticus TaxID=1751298 RepID=A0A8J3FKL9_9ACTN|nr:class I SAM-dependent methyltransferase [Mangrovihabitans endophyticus]GGK73675.1 hypothetical protein GCM10012284_04460 [Mangrovihabitans endophyticus]
MAEDDAAGPVGTSGGGRSRYVISFTDLVYAGLLGYGLQKLDMVIGRHWAEAALTGTALLYLIYDWYGEHSLEVNVSLGAAAIRLDFIALFIYFGLIYFSSGSSQYFAIFMALRAARGIVINVILIRRSSSHAARLHSYNVSSGLMTVLFVAMYAVDTVVGFSPVVRLAASFALWLFAYAAALASERIFAGRIARRIADSVPESAGDPRPTPAGDAIHNIRGGPARNDRTPVMRRASSTEGIQEGGSSMDDKVVETAKFYDASSQVFVRDFYGSEADPAIAFDVSEVWRHMRENLQPNSSILEIGCGTGHWLALMARHLGIRPVGLDISQNMLRIARHAGNTELVTAEASGLPFQEGAFDGVISPFNALDHTVRYARAFGEIRRVLKPDGLALLMLDNRQRPISRYWHVKSPRIVSRKSDPRQTETWVHAVDGEDVEVYSHLYTCAEVRNLLRGFEIKILGLGLITPLIPRSLRLRQPRIVESMLKVIGPLERVLAPRLPRFSSQLLVIARKR